MKTVDRYQQDAFSMVLGSLAAYSLARFKLRATTWLAIGMLLARMIPPIVFVVPLFLLYNAAGLRNSLPGLALVYTAFNVPFVVWLMKSFFEEVPVELEEAVLIDGGSRARAFWHVTMPLAAPGLAATSVFCVIAAWGEFLFALILVLPQVDLPDFTFRDGSAPAVVRLQLASPPVNSVFTTGLSFRVERQPGTMISFSDVSASPLNPPGLHSRFSVLLC